MAHSLTLHLEVCRQPEGRQHEQKLGRRLPKNNLRTICAFGQDKLRQLRNQSTPPPSFPVSRRERRTNLSDWKKRCPPAGMFSLVCFVWSSTPSPLHVLQYSCSRGVLKQVRKVRIARVNSLEPTTAESTPKHRVQTTSLKSSFRNMGHLTHKLSAGHIQATKAPSLR
jgi:hypothetical protein